MASIKPNRSLILPDRSHILKEATARSLNAGELIPGLPLRSSQRKGFLGYYNLLDNTADEFERRHAYADMATGSGKTGMFSLIARHAFRIAQEKGIGDDYRIFIVEPTVFLLKQTYDKFVRVAPELKDAIGIYGGASRNLSCPITIISYDSWMMLLESGQMNGIDVDININDESHEGLSLRRQNLISQVLTNAHHIGFTASSEYDEAKTMKLTHRNRFHHLTLKDAIEGDDEGGMGLTSHMHVQYGVLRLMPQAMSRKKGVDLDNIDFSALKRAKWSSMVTHAYREGFDGISGEPLSDKVGIFFASNTTHADYTADMLNNDPALKRKAEALGFKKVAVSIHSVDIPTREQELRMEAFLNGEIMSAVADGQLQAGIDYPRVKFIAGFPSGSLVDTVQKIGRAGREYFNPITGEEQGAVILDTIPYVGDADPAADEEAYGKALRGLVTARDVLGDRYALRKGRPEPKPSPKTPKKGRIPLSSGATVEMFMTHEETLTISRQVDDAHDRDRIRITPEMMNDLLRTYP